MRLTGEGEGETHGGMCVCGGKKKKKRGYWSGYRDDSDDDEGDFNLDKNSKALVKALKGDGKGGFSEIEVRRVVRGLGTEDRMRL